MSRRQTKINLIENGIHSLYKGISQLERYKQRGNSRFDLKDSIVSIHHSVELLMKQILIEENELLIFDNLTKYHNQYKNAKEQNIDVFSLQKPPYTISFDEAVSRVKSFKSPRKLDEQLVDKLKELNQLRNRIEHYEIEMDKDIVETLIAYIINPLLDLFRTHIQDFSTHENRINSELPSLSSSYRRISNEIIMPKINKISQIEKKLEYLIFKFDQQKIQNKRFVNFSNLKNVPKYTSLIQKKMYYNFKFDYSFKSNSQLWRIVVKVNPNQNTLINNINRFSKILKQDSKIIIWLILVFELSDKLSNASKLFFRKQYKKQIPNRLYITSISDWEQFVDYFNN